MEEMETLQYGSFAALGEWVIAVAPTTHNLKKVVDQAFRGHLFLDELRRECLGWKTIWHQEWGLFLLERLFHNATAIQRKNNSDTCKGTPTCNRLILPKKWPWSTLQ